MSKKLWCFAVLLMLIGGCLFTLGYYVGKRAGITEITATVLAEKMQEQDRIDKVLTGTGL